MSRVRVSSVTVGQLAVNCWFLINEDTKEALVFDPGDQADKIVQYASEQGVKITAALLTHGHIDHMGGADALRNLTGAKVYVLREDVYKRQLCGTGGISDGSKFRLPADASGH